MPKVSITFHDTDEISPKNVEDLMIFPQDATLYSDDSERDDEVTSESKDGGEGSPKTARMVVDVRWSTFHVLERNLMESRFVHYVVSEENNSEDDDENMAEAIRALLEVEEEAS